MDTTAPQNSHGPPEAGSVTNRIVKGFVDAVAAEAGLEEIASRLKKTLIEERNESESALRKAILGPGKT